MYLAVKHLEFHTKIFHLIIIGFYGNTTLSEDDVAYPALESRIVTICPELIGRNIFHASSTAAPRSLDYSLAPLHYAFLNQSKVICIYYILLQMFCGPLAAAYRAYLI